MYLQIFRWLCDLSKFISTIKPNLSNFSSVEIDLFSNLNIVDFESCLNLAIDLLITIVELSEPSCRQALLLIVIPLLCNLLLPDPQLMLSSTKFETTDLWFKYIWPLIESMHFTTLKQIITMAPRFPNEFRSVCNAIGEDLKLRLENSIKLSQSSRQMIGTSTSIMSRKHQPNKSNCHLYESNLSDPMIKLKTDFSHFK